MIPPEFEYRAPESLDEAIDLLSQGGEDTKLLAGGHSLIPLMKARLAAPARLVDLRRIDGIRGVEHEGGGWRIGALTTHAQLQDREEMGLLAHAASLIADQQVRNRGTIGGSVAHGDPASDMPAVLLAADGEVSARGPAGERTIPASELFQDLMRTALTPDEVMTELHFPSLAEWGWGYEKFTRRAEDWAIVGVCALVKVSNGSCEDVRVTLTNMGSTPLRASAVEDALRGQPLDAERIATAAEHAAEGAEPPADLNAPSDYKRHLARVLSRRALTQAAGID